MADAYGKIISINPNFPGSTHDAAIWNASHLKKTLERQYINGERDQWLLGMYFFYYEMIQSYCMKTTIIKKS